MYTLRRITREGIEMNFNLGNSYTVVDKEKNPETFKQDYEMYFHSVPNREDDDKVYAFVSAENGLMHPLWMSQKNYIMTESGNTFSNLSIR